MIYMIISYISKILGPHSPIIPKTYKITDSTKSFTENKDNARALKGSAKDKLKK